jgi:serine kinase of HPr protein (carbohydrate metabolism regulator)
MTLSVRVDHLAAALGAEPRVAANATVELPVECPEWLGSGPAHPLRFATPEAPTEPPPSAWILAPTDPVAPDATTPILATNRPTADLRYRAGHFLDGYLPRLINATLVAVGSTGVLLRGPAGCGKSLAAVALVDRGHRMVSDDAVRLYAGTHGTIEGHAPEATGGFACLRGLGPIKLDDHYRGHRLTAHPIHLVVTLSDDADSDPLEGGWTRHGLMGRQLTALRLRASHSPALLVELAARMLARNDQSSIERIEEQQQGHRT